MWWFFTLLLLMIAQLCHGLILSIVNPNVIQHKLIGQPIYTEMITQGSYDVVSDSITSICFTIDGRVCECFQPDAEGVLSTVLTAACVRPETEKSYWFGAIAKQEGQSVYRTEIASLPVHVARSLSALVVQEARANLVTLVLPLTVSDFARSSILFESLRKIDYGKVYELLLFVPDAQLETIRELMAEGLVPVLADLKFPVRLLAESILFDGVEPGTYSSMVEGEALPYGVQMAVKLLAAHEVSTPFYLTLDADCVLLQQWTDDTQIMMELKLNGVGGEQRTTLAMYDYESRVQGDHPDWWDAGDAFLRLPGREFQTQAERAHQGFSVTPALLSTYGSLLTVERILTQVRLHHCLSSGCNAVLQWLMSFGRSARWSEYTLYAIILDYYRIFGGLHAAQQELHARGPDWAARVAKLHCFDLWYAPTANLFMERRDNIWLQMMFEDVTFVDAGTGNEVVMSAENRGGLGNCLFSVIQSHAHVPVEVVQSWVQRLFPNDP